MQLFIPIQTIKDWILVVVIAIVVTIDLSILFIGTAVPESRLAAVNIFDAEHVITITVCTIHVER